MTSEMRRQGVSQHAQERQIRSNIQTQWLPVIQTTYTQHQCRSVTDNRTSPVDLHGNIRAGYTIATGHSIGTVNYT